VCAHWAIGQNPSLLQLRRHLGEIRLASPGIDNRAAMEFAQVADQGFENNPQLHHGGARVGVPRRRLSSIRRAQVAATRQSSPGCRRSKQIYPQQSGNPQSSIRIQVRLPCACASTLRKTAA
jgi:hypothetical protein